MRRRLAPLEVYARYKLLHLARHRWPPGPYGTGAGRMVVNRDLTEVTHELTDATYGGDANLWTGVLLSALALEHGLAKDPALLDPIRDILDAYEWLEQGQTLLPAAEGYIPRGVELDQGRSAEPSGDQYTGILVGYALCMRFVDHPGIRARIVAQAHRIGRYLQANGYFLFRPQGGRAFRGANCVHWEYPWSRMLLQITGEPYRASGSFGDFWSRLPQAERAEIVAITGAVATALLAPGVVLFAVAVATVLATNVPGLGAVMMILQPLLGEVLVWLSTALNVFGLAGKAAVVLLLAFLIALFAVLGEDALGVILNLLHGDDARAKYRTTIGVLAGEAPDFLNRLAELIRSLEPIFPKAGDLNKYPVNYYNYHVAFLASFGAFFGANDPEAPTLERLYERRIVEAVDPETEERDYNALFALIARALFGRRDSFTERAIATLDGVGVFPEERLPNTWDDSIFHNNYAWQKFPHVRRERAGVSPPKEWPGLDYLLPAILRAYLDRMPAPPACSPAAIEYV